MTPTPWPLPVGDVVLRYATAADLPSLLAFRNDPDVNRYTIRTHEDPDALGRACLGAPDSETDFTCVGERGGEVVALGLLHVVDGEGQPGVPAGTEGTIGYLVAPWAAGHGVGTAMARGLLTAAFDVLGLRRVTAGCYADNAPSVRILEKVGMRREQHGIEDSWHDELGWVDGYTYAMLRREWPSHRRSE